MLPLCQLLRVQHKTCSPKGHPTMDGKLHGQFECTDIIRTELFHPHAFRFPEATAARSLFG
ncbi:hypothetical protein B0E33_10020 [Roseibium algicola]|uniref:Uncharacterized protein n=1 Tax=Roseibium algicola TaxID=2857014 RepID=A0ABN4WQ75_9HYPH|nr:hypothetical protein B0E33_10020 [Roseibium aggregatum]